jgi:YbgC/YbaW family acyl-CoA thioester hydrolase
VREPGPPPFSALAPVLDFATMHEPPPSGPFHTRIRVRYEETDAAGVVYYANYLVYFEVARVEALRAVGLPITEVERRGVILPAVNASCTYHSPAHVDDLLDVAMWTDHVGRASFGFCYEVRRVGDGATAVDAPAPGAIGPGGGSPADGASAPEATLVASGTTRHAVVARDTMKPVRIEGWIAELMARAQEWRPPS